MKPTPGDVHVNRPLTNMSLAIFQSMDAFVATQVFPRISSEKKSDSYFTFDEKYFNRDLMQPRAPGARAELVKYKVSTDSYLCNVWAAAHAIPDEVRENADAPLNLDMQANELLVRIAKIRMEKMWVNKFFKGGVWDYDWDGVSAGPFTNEVLQWNDESSDPVKNIADASLAILGKTGLRPNTLVVGAEVDNVLLRHPDILARVVYGGSPGAPAVVTRAALRDIFNVQRYLVMESIEETSHEEGTASPAFIGGKKALLVYTPPNPGIMVPAAGYTFAWAGMTGATLDGYRIKKFREEPEASDVIEIQLACDMKLTGGTLGAFFDTIIA